MSRTPGGASGSSAMSATTSSIAPSRSLARTLSLLDDVWRSQINSLDKTIASWSTPGQIPRQGTKTCTKNPPPSTFVLCVPSVTAWPLIQ